MLNEKKYIIVSHCLLNDFTNVYDITEDAFDEINRLLTELRNQGYRIIQLPCPEFLLLGKPRPPMTRRDYERVGINRIIDSIVVEIRNTVVRLYESGYVPVALIGVRGSPSCGVTETHTTTLNRREKGMGILVERLISLFDELNIPIQVLEFDFRRPEESVDLILKELHK